MPRFSYEAMDARGQTRTATIDAESEEAAQTYIRQLGYFVTKITLDKSEKPATMQEPIRTVPTWELILEILKRFRPRFPTRKCSCCTGDCK